MNDQRTIEDDAATTAHTATAAATSSSTTSTDLLLEAARLSQAAYADTAGAPPSGWEPVSLGTAAAGVQLVDVGALAGLPPGAITSAAHVYEGSPDGESTLAIAFRGTDEGANEFAFQASPLPPDNPLGAEYGWDLYYAAHAPLVEDALQYAAAHDVERVLVTGHSLGGVLAELTAQRAVAGFELADGSLTVTFGSPGSSENGDPGIDIVNVVHSDDLVPLLSEKSPLLAFLEREGVDLVVDRPEASLEGLPPLDTPEALFQATQNTAYKIEHQIPLYLDTAAALAENARLTPGVADSAQSFAWLDVDVERFVLGDDTGERYSFADGSQVLIGRGGNDRLAAGPGDDGLSGGLGNDGLDGGDGDDLMDGGPGRDRLSAGPGDDLVYASAGIDKIDGGPGEDTVVFPGSIDDYRGVREGTHRVAWDGGSGADVMVAQLEDIETLRFDGLWFDI
jgi:Ca2+-binding RTX toxin-like protein